MKLELSLHYEEFNCLEMLKHHQNEGRDLKLIYRLMKRPVKNFTRNLFRICSEFYSEFVPRTNTGDLECLAYSILYFQ